MYLLIIGVVLTLLKYLEIGFVADWDWWWVLAPYAGAALWWVWADTSGYTKRKAAQKIEQRKQQRIDKNRDALGMRPRKPRR